MDAPVLHRSALAATRRALKHPDACAIVTCHCCSTRFKPPGRRQGKYPCLQVVIAKVNPRRRVAK
jgi:hypothetical protein